MSQLDVLSLENNFKAWKTERGPDMSVSDAFERYSVETVFRDADLSDDDISSGLIGRGNDGGVDGAYFLMDDRVMLEDTPLPSKIKKAALWIIQAKYTNSFQEAPLLKIKSFIEDALDFRKNIDDNPTYSERVKDFLRSFREKLGRSIGLVREISINIVYVTKSDHAPSTGVLHRKNEIEDLISKYLGSAKTQCEFWGAKKLVEVNRSAPDRKYSLDVERHFDHGNSFIGVARLDRYAQFLTDENGNLRYSMLEPNVRDYNGTGNPVNVAIRATLAEGGHEFWWLNNGITILAAQCDFGMGKLNITAPEVVNGLQTSTEIFNHFEARRKIDSVEPEDGRHVLVRVIIPPNETARRRIVKATNSQTPVSPLSLYANDDIHFDIEELFRLHGLYYDRRKGEWRRKRMPVAQITSMTDVAQAVMSIALRYPDDARARPRKRLDDEQQYQEVFDSRVDRAFFLVCILLDRHVKSYLESRADISRDERTDIRFYMDTWLASDLVNKERPSKSEIAAFSPEKIVSTLSNDKMVVCCETIRLIYKDQGGDSKAAKGPSMREAVLGAIKKHFDTLESVG